MIAERQEATEMAVERAVGFPHIVRDPEVQGGEPTIIGTRIPVRVIIVAHRFTPDNAYLCAAYPSLTPALIAEALAYYAAHQAEIDRYIVQNDTDLD
jgi:uncharacterized protein (DUF433 family)